jgi:hypothetical protein
LKSTATAASASASAETTVSNVATSAGFRRKFRTEPSQLTRYEAERMKHVLVWERDPDLQNRVGGCPHVSDSGLHSAHIANGRTPDLPFRNRDY